LPVAVIAGVFVPFFAGFLSAIAKHLRASNESQPLDLRLDSPDAQRSSWMRMSMAVRVVAAP
jgi:hypothetical protein